MILRKAAEHAASRNIAPGVLVNARLFPDMYALAKQVQIATDQARLRRTTGRHRDSEIRRHGNDLEELQARIIKTIAFLDSVKAEQIDGSEERDISFQIHERKFEFKGKDYLISWVFPNFYFHATTAYNILRHNGIELGKKDFLGG